jgi:hypothetical protein
MKNLIAALTVLLTVTSASAFFNGNNSWNTPWNNNHSNGYQEDNGIFAYNSYDFWDPRWYSQEFTNFVTEMDDEFSNDDYSKRSYYRVGNNNFPAVDTNK